ncbi:putative laccase [Helianthus annuus]|uniref:Laccase n=1 Tax=Helianthus annuus TaxID=4232 RepID=A0A9K3N3A8_HELAN|nr:putative laccase [Helianthus annuus]
MNCHHYMFKIDRFNFFVLGKGLGNYNPKVDPNNFNLVDPVERNTIGVASGGWVASAIRFRLDNPSKAFIFNDNTIDFVFGLCIAAWKCIRLGGVKWHF